MDEEEGTTIYALRLQNELHLVSITSVTVFPFATSLHVDRSFLYFDHAISFGDEVRFLWRKAKTRSTYYFFVNRYLAFFGDIAITVFHFMAVPTSWALVGKSGVPVPNVVGCHIDNSQKLGIYLAVPWEALLLYDVLIFWALSHKSYRTRADSEVFWWYSPLFAVLIRDGAIYFTVMAIMNLGNILTFYTAGPLLRGCLSTMASCMSVTLTSRLMLNLHSVDRTGIFSTTQPDSSWSTAYNDAGGGYELDTLRVQDLE
ncbi:hypothetical protein C8R47DRAFT_1280792 [Mycena vitilis]|nr:hypothetical protein C8R47DRAFT_1280792 [Mycena vitilis]